MSKSFSYPNKGTCSKETHIVLNDDHTIESIEVIGGCNGNLKGISRLLKGMKAEDAIARMEGTTCGPRPTSCPDQIAQNLSDLIDFPIVNKRLFLPIRQLLLDSRQGLSFTGPEQLSVRDRILELTRMQGFQSATAFLDILNALATANRKVLMSNLCDSKNIVHTSKSRRIAKVCDYIEKNLCQNIRLTDVAGLVNMSESAFSHFFKKRTNISYITFVNNMRISKACQLLANTTLSASEICYACGFNNKSNFIRIFTKKKNMTPIEYREYISQMLIKY